MPVSIPSTSPPVMSKLRRAASSTPDTAKTKVPVMLVRFAIGDRRALAKEQLRDRATSVCAGGVFLCVGLRDSVDGDEGVGREVEAVARWFLVQFDFDAHPGQDIELVDGEHALQRLAEAGGPGHGEELFGVVALIDVRDRKST